MIRIPRKKKKKIPKDTFYCYTAMSNMIFPDEGLPYFKIKPCPYYNNMKEIIGFCSLLKCEVIDQVKECNESIGRYV